MAAPDGAGKHRLRAPARLKRSASPSAAHRAGLLLARAPCPREAQPLDGAAETEIAVVGAGLTGLRTAIFVKELTPELDVAVVEQGLAAHGASGRNAGMLSETVDHSHGLAIEHFGQVEARRLARLGETNVAELVAFLDREQIRCDHEPSGRLMVALTQRQLEDVRRTVEIAQSLGLDSFRYLDQRTVRAELDSPLYLGGVGVTGGGILDPVKLVDGLREAAERRGVRIFERSRVTAVERCGAGARIQTEGARLDARRVVLATSAYTHHLLPEITHRSIPLYDYVLVSDPLSADQRAASGWLRRQGVTDGRAFFNYYRLAADDRILWGTSEATYYPGRANPRPHGARPGERAPRARTGSPEAVSLSTRATPLLVGSPRDTGAPPGRSGGAPESAASAARSVGDRVFELNGAPIEVHVHRFSHTRPEVGAGIHHGDTEFTEIARTAGSAQDSPETV